MDREKQQAFLEAIRANPGDDLPRLVYADWLDEHCEEGQPGWPLNEQGMSARAEFIRVQCERARLPKKHPDRKALAAREKELLFAEEGSFKDVLNDWFDGTVTRAVYSRGFIRDLALSEHRLELLIDNGFPPHEPVVKSLRLMDIFLDDDTAAALATCPHLAPLQQLDLSFNEFGSAGVAALAASPHLANLRLLNLECNDIDDAGVMALANAPHLTNLQSLYLACTSVTDAGVNALANAPHLASLHTLDLSNDELGRAAVEALVHSPYLSDRAKRSGLSSLNIPGAEIDDLLAASVPPGPRPGSVSGRPTAATTERKGAR